MTSFKYIFAVLLVTILVVPLAGCFHDREAGIIRDDDEDQKKSKQTVLQRIQMISLGVSVVLLFVEAYLLVANNPTLLAWD